MCLAGTPAFSCVVGSSAREVFNAAFANVGTSNAVAPPPSTSVIAAPTAILFIALLLVTVIVSAFLFVVARFLR